MTRYRERDRHTGKNLDAIEARLRDAEARLGLDRADPSALDLPRRTIVAHASIPGPLARHKSLTPSLGSYS